MRIRSIFALTLFLALATGALSPPDLFATGQSKPTPTPQPTPRKPQAPPPGGFVPTPGANQTVGPSPAASPTGIVATPRVTPPVSSSGPRWSNPATWPGGRVPTRDNDVVIPAGRVVEVDTLTAEARTVTVDGTLRASRSGASRLTVYGNLILRNQGALDYGTPTDRVQAPAAIRFFLDEARIVGGPPMAGPVESDVGLWAIDDSRVFVHGSYRDAWSPLAQTARAGSIEVQVDPDWARGWRVGDMILIGPSNLRTSDNDFQDEVRRITADVGGGRYQLDAALRFNHEVLSVPWTDAWGVAYTERLAAKVANLTSNVTFEAGDPNHRPHVIFMERARHYVEDLAVINFSPMPNQSPMARYGWHDHMQGEGSRGSYLRRARIYGGPGIGLSVHESYGVEVEDVVIYNQARAYVERGGQRLTDTTALLLERTRGTHNQQQHAADDCWIDRPLVVRWGTNFRDFRNAGIWLTGSVNCPVMGAVTAGGAGSVFSSGIHWEEGGGGGETPYLYRAETNSNRMAGVLSWQNNTPAQPIIDLLTWRNGETGVMWGAYGTRYWGFHFRALGNGLAQLQHTAAGWGITGFLADGMGVAGTTGIRIGRYFTDSTRDSVYEDGVVRGVATNLAHIEGSATGESSWIQFARIRWDAGRAIRFGPAATPPLGSRFRIRQQTGLSRPSDFTLYRRDDTSAPGSKVTDLEFNALRWDNDTQGTRPRPPRIAWAGSLADDSVTTGSITLTVQTDASEVEFYLANRSLGRVQVSGGYATMTFNMGGHPRRRAYFWAAATRNGALSTTRVLRVMRY